LRHAVQLLQATHGWYVRADKPRPRPTPVPPPRDAPPWDPGACAVSSTLPPQPHLLPARLLHAAFHGSWFGFFASFYSTFAAASLSAYIIPDLDLSDAEWAQSGIMAVCGTIFFRLVMGWICDRFGARKGLGYLLLLTTPAIVLIMFAQNAWQFILLRTCIGFSLATFVACQTWCSQMFAKKVVGIANATAAGWGNLGGGITNLTMPFIFLAFRSFASSDSVAWRLSYLVPLVLHIVGGMVVLQARDLPDGNFAELESSGAKQKADSKVVLKVGFSNINAWILTITYGMCFGIELTMNNVAARYFYAYQGLTPQIAGICASCWGLMNIIARSIGGWISDWANKKAGMRGRLWATWVVQTLEGVFCILLGLVTINMDAPNTDKTAPTVNAFTYITPDTMRNELLGPSYSGWVDMNATCFGVAGVEAADLRVAVCNTKKLDLSDALANCLKIAPGTIMRQTAPAEFGGPDLNCISNSGTVGLVMLLVVCFSLCVQAAEGLHYGVVPYVSRPALGVVSGMVGAGGNTGAVVAGNLFFAGSMRTDQAIINMGIMIIALTCLLMFVYFPDKGGMFVKAGGLGKYDPQIIKPPEGYGGTDKMDFEAAKKQMASQESATVTSSA
jgi:NNP family nitrate/nitrite transporter-like MFS transporter